MKFENIRKNFGFGCMRLPMRDGEVNTEEFSRMADAFLENGWQEGRLITFCFLAAQGGGPLLTSHAAANMRIGNDKGFLIKIISQCLPFIGYPRSLNALRCVNEAAENKE